MFTDDLSSMGAINQRYGVADAVLRALQAGADVALWVTTDEVPAVLDRLEKALAAGELSQPGSTIRCCGWPPTRARIRGADADSSRIAYPEVSSASQKGTSMAGGTKRLPRAVREQQMLDAAVQMFSVNGYHETSMDAIAAQAEISKPMLYLYYGSKEELFGACLDRELTRFVDVVRADIDFKQSPKDLLRNAVLSFLNYIDTNRASWIVLYTQATSSQAFAHTVREGRERIIDLVGTAAAVGHP